jgi:hypothetical protein
VCPGTYHDDISNSNDDNIDIILYRMETRASNGLRSKKEEGKSEHAEEGGPYERVDDSGQRALAKQHGVRGRRDMHAELGVV